MTRRVLPIPYHKNPRKISDKRLDDLREWLAELGDLGGIVHDLNSNEIVGGNQRSRAIDLTTCQIEVHTRLRRPDSQGTVALGYVVWQGNRYAYRQVRWTPEQCEKANVVANSAGGEWDWDILKTEFDAGKLGEWGFDAEALKSTKFDLSSLGDLLESQKEPPVDVEPQIDKASELQEKWQVSRGDLFGIGKFTRCPKCGKIHNLDGV